MNESKIDKDYTGNDLPSPVGIAAVLSIVGGFFLSFQVVYYVQTTLEGRLLLSYGLFLFAVGFSLFFLKRWAYWAFIIIASLNSLDVISDFLLLAFDIPLTWMEIVIRLLQLAILITFIVYFLSSNVRDAFGEKPLW